MSSIIQLHDCSHLPACLRNVADELERGDWGDIDAATLIFPGAREIFHFGTPPYDEHAGLSAMFDMQCGIAKISNRVISTAGEPE